MRTIVAGSRTVTDYTLVERAMAEARVQENILPTVILSGTAPGVDTLGERWAREHHLPVEEYPALWDDVTVQGAVVRTRPDGTEYNILAGNQRNERMAQEADALVAITCGTPGTRDMLERARVYRLRIFRYPVF